MTRSALALALSEETGLPLVDLLSMTHDELDALSWDYPGAVLEAAEHAADDDDFSALDRYEPLEMMGRGEMTLAEYLGEDPEPDPFDDLGIFDYLYDEARDA